MKNKITHKITLGAFAAAFALAVTVTTSASADDMTTMTGTATTMSTTGASSMMGTSMTSANRAALISLIQQILSLMNQELIQLQSAQGTTTTNTTTMNTSTGVMVGGALMTPNLDIVQNAIQASNVTTVVAAVKAAGLVPTLESAGPFTVFAPDNNAFAKLPGGTVDSLLMPANLSTLKDILTYHVVAGRYTSADLYDGEKLTTVEGKILTIGKSAAGQITINGTAMVETPDIISSNGVTFVIDTVLMPPAAN